MTRRPVRPVPPPRGPRSGPPPGWQPAPEAPGTYVPAGPVPAPSPQEAQRTLTALTQRLKRRRDPPR